MNVFTHLHVHSEFSLFDGCMKVENLFQKAQKLGMHAMAITDHHTLFSWFRMYAIAKRYQIKPLYGIELNVGKHHLTAIALNETGLHNLSILNNLGYVKKTKTQISEKELQEHHEGIFVLSGCSKGKVPSFLHKQDKQKALETTIAYKQLFSNRFALELQNYGQPHNQQIMRALITLGVKAGVEVFPTNDCHYLEQEDYSFHADFMQMKTLGKVTQHNQQNYVKSQCEMAELFPEFMLNQTQELVGRVQVDFQTFLTNHQGTNELPISVYTYFDDAESLRKILYAKKNYKLGQFMYAKMRKEALSLEQIYLPKEYHDILPFAKRLRGTLQAIQPDPHLYVKVNHAFPFYRTANGKPYCAQIDEQTARLIGFPIYDRRKIKQIR